MPALIFFDLDGTLTESKQPLTEKMASLLERLLSQTVVAIISGGALPQFLTQVVEPLPQGTNLSHLFLLPTSGASLYEYRMGTWHKVYEERLSEKEATLIESAMQSTLVESGYGDSVTPPYGPRIEYRGGQVSLSALGQRAPLDLKKAWDPDKSKRRALQRILAAKLPMYEVAMGGLTTIDVTKRGISKAYGVHKLCERLHIPESAALYIGDELERGGNDEAVYHTQVDTKQVANPVETMQWINKLLQSQYTKEEVNKFI